MTVRSLFFAPYVNVERSRAHSRCLTAVASRRSPNLIEYSYRKTSAKCEQAQHFLSAFGSIRYHFHPKQRQLGAQRYLEQLRQRFC